MTIRYDPRDLAEIYVYADNAFVWAVCFELSNKSVSLKEVIKARNYRKKELNQNIREMLSVAEKHVPTKAPATDSAMPEYPKFKIKRFACDDVEAARVHFERPHRGNDYGRIGFEATYTALNITELLKTHISSKAGLRNKKVRTPYSYVISED